MASANQAANGAGARPRSPSLHATRPNRAERRSAPDQASIPLANLNISVEKLQTLVTKSSRKTNHLHSKLVSLPRSPESRRNTANRLLQAIQKERDYRFDPRIRDRLPLQRNDALAKIEEAANRAIRVTQSNRDLLIEQVRLTAESTDSMYQNYQASQNASYQEQRQYLSYTVNAIRAEIAARLDLMMFDGRDLTQPSKEITQLRKRADRYLRRIDMLYDKQHDIRRPQGYRASRASQAEAYQSPRPKSYSPAQRELRNHPYPEVMMTVGAASMIAGAGLLFGGVTLPAGAVLLGGGALAFTGGFVTRAVRGYGRDRTLTAESTTQAPQMPRTHRRGSDASSQRITRQEVYPPQVERDDQQSQTQSRWQRFRGIFSKKDASQDEQSQSSRSRSPNFDSRAQNRRGTKVNFDPEHAMLEGEKETRL